MPLDVKGGYLTVAHWRRVPIRLHWSTPIGALIWTGGELSVIRVAAFVAIIVIHELGHAILIRRARAQVDEITVHAMGGECAWHGHATPMQRAAIAFGGVWAQLLLAIATWIVATVAPGALHPALLDMFIGYNLFNAAFNLVPVEPLDGARAWRLFPLLFARVRDRVRGGWRRLVKARRRRKLRVIEGDLKDVLMRAARRTRDL